MKRKICVLLALFLSLSLVLCSCSSVDQASYDSQSSAPMASGSLNYSKTEADYGYAEDYYYEPEAPMKETTSSSGAALLSTPASLANAKLVYTADITLETTEFDASAEGIVNLVSSLEGYFENSYVNNHGTYRRGSYIVRVPSHNYEAFCTAASEICSLKAISRSVENISESYYDNESRLITQKTKLERLQTLLAKAENMEDIITLESAISETELAIERLTGTLRKYDSMVDFATISVTLNEVYKVVPIEQPPIGFGEKLLAAFGSGCKNFVSFLEDMMLSFAYNWIGNLIFIAVVIIIVIIAVKRIKKRKAAKSLPEENIKK